MAKGKVDYKDLFEFELSDNSYIRAWTDGELTFFSIRFATLCIPNELFEELLSALTQYHRDTINHTRVS